MAKCPRCGSRKAKRHCPALAADICPVCCAEGRLKTIACPRDCPYLAGELYQHERRKVTAVTRGRRFLERQERLFADPAAREFAFRLQADIYYFTRANGPVDDAAMADALETLASYLSKVYVPPSTPAPLSGFLIQRLADERRYGTGPRFSAEDRRRAIGALSAYARSLAKAPGDAPAAGSGRFLEEVSSFFDSLDFEADLDYSPDDEGKGEGQGSSPGAAPAPPPGKLILPYP